MERLSWFIAALLFGCLLVMAGIVNATAPKDKTLDPDTCQEAGTCWIPAGGDPQPILSKVEKGTFAGGYETGKKFALPGGKKGDGLLLWMAIIEEWYGPWVLINLGSMSYYAATRRIVLESRGNPYAATKSTTWIERSLTSLNPAFCEKHGFDPCGDPEIAIWGMMTQNEERRATFEEKDGWAFLDDWPREEREIWLSFSGSINAGSLKSMAKKAKVDQITPQQRENGVTPWTRLIGMMKKWDNNGKLYIFKGGIAITNWRLGFRGGRCKNNQIVFPQISGIEGVDGMGYGHEEFRAEGSVPPMPTPKYPWPGEANFGKKCLKHQKEWREIMGKLLTNVLRRGDDDFKKMQEKGFFPSDEEYEWFDENIGPYKIADSPLVKPLLDDLNKKNPPPYLEEGD
jgi:hypothetical protein